jgi:tRNA nucleotidyltransferase (CCA-adding enzyme)
MRLKLPIKVAYILDILKRHGFEAYAVGGCVRDSILARDPDDWDITTSAKPEQVKRCFRRTIDTGIQHGTVTVMLEEDGFEVTTYRIDGTYSDGRHPDQVTFTPNLEDDLMRRDFTINAMAYNEEEGLVDLFGGMRDLQKKVIRCVGRPDERFDEDALRIMRAVRFAAQLGFSIDPDTRLAVKRHAQYLTHVSAERIRVELMKLLVSPNPKMFLDLYLLGITGVILPEFDRCMETQQNSKHHRYNVGEHTIRAMCAVPEDSILRLTMLLHDFGKPAQKRTDERGRDHFKGHAEKSAEMAEVILRRLKFDNDTRKKVVHLVRWHDFRPAVNEPEVRRAIHLIGKENFEDYLAVQWADNSAKSEYKLEEKQKRVQDVYDLYKKITARGDCLTVRELALSGEDLLQMGLRGPAVGEALNAALEDVLEDPAKNRTEVLKMLVRERFCTEKERAAEQTAAEASEGREAESKAAKTSDGSGTPPAGEAEAPC